MRQIFNNIFTRDDTHEFKPTLAEIEDNPASPLGRVTFWIIISVILFFAVWLCIGEVDVVITARGSIIPDGDVKILQPLDTGVVSKILCREGDYVKKGQVLIEIDPSITSPELEARRKSLGYLELEKNRLSSILENKPFLTTGKRLNREFTKIQKEIHQSLISDLEKQLQIKMAELGRNEEETRASEKELAYTRSILRINTDKEIRYRAVLDIISRSDYEKVQNDILANKNTIEQLTHKIEQLKFQKDQIKNEIAHIDESFKTTILKETSDKQKQVTELAAEIEKTSFRNEKQSIVSPVDGHVSDLMIHTIGGVVTPAQKILSVVPIGSPLVMRATVLNKDIGYVTEGMNVSAKIDTFDFQKYGLIKGIIRNVSKHCIEDEKLGKVYEIFVVPQNKSLIVDGKKVKISSGMTLTAEVKVGSRKIIEFFIYPLIKYLDEGISVK